MTGSLPRPDRWLLAGQAIGGVAAGLAWLQATANGWPWPALALLAAGLIMATAAFVALGQSFRVAPTPHRHARLVRHGVYRVLRHPMYGAAVLVVAAAACSRPSTTMLVVAGLNFALYFAKARYEERILLHHYPDYANYRARTVGVRPLPPAAGTDRGSDDEGRTDSADGE